MQQWLYEGKPFLEAPENSFGFVYLITNTVTGQKYIGRKQFWSNTSKKVAGKKNRKHTIKESDWKKYHSSSDDVKRDIELQGEDTFSFEIIQLCEKRGDLTYAEVEHQIKCNVLTAKLPSGIREYYNRNILARWFIHPEKCSPETIEKLKGNKNALGSKRTPEVLVVMSRKMKGNQHLKGHKYTPEEIAQRAESKSREWLVTFPDRHSEKVKNLSKFCRENNLSAGNLNGVASGKKPSHKGFTVIKA